MNDLQSHFWSHTQTLNDPDGKEVKVVMQQMATDVDQVKIAIQQRATDTDQVKVVAQRTATDVDQVRVATQQTAADVDQVKRLSSRFIMLTTVSHPSFQAPNCAKAFTDGSPHQIPQ